VNRFFAQNSTYNSLLEEEPFFKAGQFKSGRNFDLKSERENDKAHHRRALCI
jgi:hypothetical protein